MSEAPPSDSITWDAEKDILCYRGKPILTSMMAKSPLPQELQWLSSIADDLAETVDEEEVMRRIGWLEVSDLKMQKYDY